MSESPRSAIVDALRAAFERPADVNPAEILVESVENVIFQMRALAPPAVVTARALHDHLQSGPINASDQAAFADWEASVTAMVELFLFDPGSATSTGCSDFIDSCEKVFGVQPDAVILLLGHFSRLSEPQRVGIFLSIDRSPAFSFLARLIDSAPADTPFENPTKAMRALLSRTFSAQ